MNLILSKKDKKLLIELSTTSLFKVYDKLYDLEKLENDNIINTYRESLINNAQDIQHLLSRIEQLE